MRPIDFLLTNEAKITPKASWWPMSLCRPAIPIIYYNPRNLTTAALMERGYVQNGWPYAPCGILTRPNGFDLNCQRASFISLRLI